MAENGDSAVLRRYNQEWARFYAQSFYLPQPFRPIEAAVHHSRTGQVMMSGGGGDARGGGGGGGGSAAPKPVDNEDSRLLLGKVRYNVWQRESV